MPSIKIPTSFNVDLEFELPSFANRLFSWCLDMLFQYIYLLLMAKWLKELEGNYFSTDYTWLIYTVAILPISMYHLLMEVFSNGQSFGKKIIGIKVVNTKGGKPSFSQFMIRWLLRISDLWMALIVLMLLMNSSKSLESLMVIGFGLIFLITDFLLVVVSKKAQRVGDILANTLVINSKTASSLDGSIFMEVEDNYQPLFPDVMRISDKDLNIIKSILDNQKSYNKTELLNNVCLKVKNYLKIETELNNIEFLEHLLKDYNHISTK